AILIWDRSIWLDNHKAVIMNTTSAGTSHQSSMDLSPGSRPARDLSMGRGFQAIAHAAQRFDLRAGVDQLLAQAMHQHLDRLQVDLPVVGRNAVKYLLLRYGLAAALYKHLQRRELARR